MHQVIVADDEVSFRRWLRLTLDNSPDFQVVGEASSGTETVRLAELLSPDAIIADIYMPELDGVEAAHYIKKRMPDIKIILISAYEGRVYQGLAQESGAIAFIPKSGLSLCSLRQALQTGE
jgi:YesN/AraC family two-component response regulator